MSGSSIFDQLQEDHTRLREVADVGMPRPDQTRVIAVANQKGGVGKTSTAVNLAAALAESGLRVVLIDADSQGNASTALGVEHGEGTSSVYDVLVEGSRLRDVLVETRFAPTLWCVPATIDVAAVEIDLISAGERESRLRLALREFLVDRARSGEPRIDYVIIDCPPSLGLLTLNALTAADYIIIPVQAQYLAMRGMAKLMDIIRIVQERLNSNLKVGGIVITQFDRRKTLNRSVREIVNDSFHEKVFKTVIRDNVALAEAPINGKTIFEYNPKSNGASDYMSLAKEVLNLK